MLLPKSGFIRWAAVVPLLVLSSVLLLYINLRMDMHLKRTLEHFGTVLNGAQVTLKDLSIHWFSGNVSLTGLEVANPENPKHNRFEINQIQTQFSWNAALRGKVLLPLAKLEGIQVDTPRKHSGAGAIPTPPDHPFWKLPTALQTTLDDLKAKHTGPVLESLPALLEKFDPATEFIEHRDQLKSPKAVKSLGEQVAQHHLRLKADLETLPKSSDFLLIKARMNRTRVDTLKSLEDLQKMLTEIESTYELIAQKVQTIQEKNEQFKQTLQQLEADVLKLEQVIQEDVQYVASQLKLPQVALENLSASLFGRDVLNRVDHLQKLWQLWQAFQQQPKQTFFWEKRHAGQDFQFGTQNHHPWFWLQQLIVTSGDRELRTAEFSGTLAHLTSHPQWIQQFLNIDLKGNIPQSDIHNIQFSLKHPDADPQAPYQLTLSVDQYPTLPLQLAAGQTLTLSATAQHASSNLSSQLSEKAFQVHWTQIFHAAQFNFTSTMPALQEVITPALDRIQDIQVEADFKLTEAIPDFQVSSNLGTTLKEALQTLTQEKMLAAQQKIREFVENKIRGERHAVESQFAELQTTLLQTVTRQLNEAKDTQALVQTKLDHILKQKHILETQVQELKSRATETGDQAKDTARRELNRELDKAVQDTKSRFNLSI